MQSPCQQWFTESQVDTREDTYTPSSEPAASSAYEAAPPPYEQPHQPASPVVDRQSPWWETEARKLICSGPTELIPHLLRFRCYGQKDFLYDALQHCETLRLNEILTGLTAKETVPTFQDAEIVANIMKLVEPACPSPNLIWPWEPRQTEDLDIEQIANVIRNASLSLLTHVEFEDCFRHALDYKVRSVENLVVQHRCIAFRIRCYLHEHPMKTDIYQQVEQKLRNRYPLAHQAVIYGLSSNTPTNLCLDLICEPLRQFVEDPTLSLGAILTRLPILAIRFDRFYRGTLFPLWHPRFTIETDTFNALIAGSPEYAIKMTFSDISNFRPLDPQLLRARGPQRQRLAQISGSFCDTIAECGKAYPRLNYRLDEIAKELYTCRNWYRLAALVFGQQEAELDSFYSSLFIPTHNFAVCRAEMKERPGLPFLAPYLREDYPTRDADFLEVFSPNRTEAVLVPSTTKPSLFGRFKARMRNLN